MSQNLPAEGLSSTSNAKAHSEPDHAHAREVLGALFTSSSFSRREVSEPHPPMADPQARRGTYF